MTNPKNKKTKEQFIKEIPKELKIIITGEYINTDTKIEYTCNHGTNFSLPWQIKKMKHCCRKGYYESGDMWRSNTNTIEDARERTLRDRPNTDVSNVYFEWDGRYKRLYGIKCIVHDIEYSSILGSKVGQCPECFKDDNREKLRIYAPKAWASESTGSFVSKAETKWLDELGIMGRQVWLEDVKYKVDGYDSISKTVYLYHGRFWHGCPATYNSEMIHPIVKVPMKDLYEKTMYYENKIRDAGYNLIVKWGN